MQPDYHLETLHKLDVSPSLGYAGERRAFYFFKRALDLFVSAIALIISLPVMLVIALLIRLDSPGPALFVQERVGVKRVRKKGLIAWQRTTFPCYKFRTMMDKADPALHQAYIAALINHDQEKMATIQHHETTTCKLVNDPRVTRPGRFLRRSSLDELPQFWNVLMGQMSLVGPRPAIPYEIDLYEPWYLRRLEAKPGLTGLWQVTARSSVGIDEMARLDIEYIEHQSFWLDLKILLKTPLVVLACKGAH